MTDRVKCVECDRMILLSTAQRNAGLCGQCTKIPAEMRAKSREFDASVASGSIFLPRPEDEASAVSRDELIDRRHEWRLEPEFYADSTDTSPRHVIEAASRLDLGNVFLVAPSDVRLNLSFNTRLGVIEYINESTGEYLYAASSSNASHQVTPEDHVVQACPCCGVGMLWYPSRFHMPRELAFGIVRAVAQAGRGPDLRWLPYQDDISYVAKGRG